MSEPVYFFGCMRGAYGFTDAGHFAYKRTEDGARRGAYAEMGVNWFSREPWGRSVDAGLAPRVSAYKHADELPQGQALLHHMDGWTALSFWDRTGDGRGNSNSTFLVQEELGFDELLARARETWPELFERFTFEVVRVDAPCRFFGKESVSS